MDSIRLKMDYYYEFGGFMYPEEEDGGKNSYEFSIRNLSSDSLNITLTQFLDDYRFRLQKLPPDN